MSGIRVAAHQRELERASPWLLVKAMDDAANVRAAGTQRLGQQSLPAVSYTKGANTFTILFDRKTHLPAAIRTRDDDNISGDSNYDLILGDWKTLAVRRSPNRSLTGSMPSWQNSTTQVGANPAITYVYRSAAVQAAKPPATENACGFAADFPERVSVATYFSNGGGLKLVELALMQHEVERHNLIVAMKDHLVIFDAPMAVTALGDRRGRYPCKPIRYLVLTHHHMDIQAAFGHLAEGAN